MREDGNHDYGDDRERHKLLNLGFPQSESEKMRVPFCLSSSSLIGLGLTLLLGITSLEVLNHFSTINQGLFTASQKLHYIWTYTPTLGTPFPISKVMASAPMLPHDFRTLCTDSSVSIFSYYLPGSVLEPYGI